MPVLTSHQRRLLEDVCIKGRRSSEQAVRAALTSLSISADRPPSHLNEEDRQLRRGLRAKARQLGDKGDDIGLLIAECAYEQWHRLLFARFLAENNLLIHPDYGAPVTLDDCEDLAESLAEPDGWSVAARFAAEILPGIFRLDDPCVRLRLAPEGRLALEGILASLPSEFFEADDSLGWVYQYWQKDPKDEVNASERKVGGADLGPVTQLFTENYMVHFLLQNTLGAWWARRHPDSPLLKGFAYLRRGADGDPAAGGFEWWPTTISEVTVLDPCCGSGHFLVEAFSMLWQMRAEEEGLGVADAQDAVLRDNLFGLELDARCVQIAMFAIVLQAWKTAGAWRKLPAPNVACTGIPVRSSVSEWTVLAGGDDRLSGALTRLHVLFRDADTLGSLIDPRRAAEVGQGTSAQRSLDDADWFELAPLLDEALRGEKSDPAMDVLGQSAAGIGHAADLLSRTYTLVVTNVPYLGRGRQVQVLRDYTDRFYWQGAPDLAGACALRARELAGSHGTIALVLPETLFFLKSFEEFRKLALSKLTWLSYAALGPGAFGAISGEVVQPVLWTAGTGHSAPHFVAFDCRSESGPVNKASHLSTGDLLIESQDAVLRRPGMKVALGLGVAAEELSKYARSVEGLSTGDSARYRPFFWEVNSPDSDLWEPFQTAPSKPGAIDGLSTVIRWERGKGPLAADPGARIQGLNCWGKPGILVGRMGSVVATRYLGRAYDKSCVVLLPHSTDNLKAVEAFVTDAGYERAIRTFDKKIGVATASMVEVPFDLERWRLAGADGGTDTKPRSDDPTQWLFNGLPTSSTTPLHAAVARLAGYRWPQQPESDDLDRLADADGVVCLPSVAGEPPASDRLWQLLGVAFGSSWSPAKQKELLEESGSKKTNLADWLRDDFFKQHCALFGHRPFIWHIWDGQRDGFAALVNYHRLDRRTLEKLTYTYLGDWIERQRAEVRDEKAGAEARLAAASRLRAALEQILEGEPPTDIYVRWKPLAEQPIGWDPDVNDGVRVNVRPFVEAGVLRSSFNIHWRKDRGTNVDGSERLNDFHFTAEEKRAARGASA